MVPFTKKDLAVGRKLLDARGIGSVVFSEGTYQMEAIEEKKRYWPFLQIEDKGDLIDAFCSCKEAESGKSCQHLAAAFLFIMGKGEPLHVRFRHSFWNGIGWLCAQRHGYQPSSLALSPNGYEAFSPSGKKMFSLKAKDPKGKKKIDHLLYERAVETEETSLKFSRLPEEEIELWREGRPSSKLLYELSFWSDLAKWWMLMQERGQRYSLSFLDSFGEEVFPHLLLIEFPQIKWEFVVEKGDWELLVPTLQTIKSPLQVFADPSAEALRITFLRDEGAFLLDVEDKKEPISPEGKEVQIGNWVYVEGKGFYYRDQDPLLKKKRVEKEEVSTFFSEHLPLLQRLLKKEKIDPRSHPVQYALFFDREIDLHIEAYLFKKGDLQEESSHYFGSWAYLRGKGFFHLDEQVTDRETTVIKREEISEFINRHRLWLQGFEGFQTHVSGVEVFGVESHLDYRLNQNRELTFFTRLQVDAESESIIDFGDWIYIEGKGFYSKIFPRVGGRIYPGLTIAYGEIAKFIEACSDELETIPGFFLEQCPLKRSGLHIGFDQEGRIQVNPEYFFIRGCDPEKVVIIGDYVFVEGKGFAKIPYERRLPNLYNRSKVISSDKESYFIGHELDLLISHALSVDHKLRSPRALQAKLLGLKHDPESKRGQWLLELSYQSEIGQVPLFAIWSAIWSGKPYLFSDAGLISLKDRRFDWLRTKARGRWLKKGTVLRLTTLELLRLCVMQELIFPEDKGKKRREVQELLERLLNFQAPTEIDLKGLKSDLRPYQKMGVAWLWFLYSYGLSGLLCDEMGLGKTHQAMGLIAGIKNTPRKKAPKFLVVCPTSVVYHWEKLLEEFLPSVTPYVFHGMGRRFETFTEGAYDILLTSYGIVRTENAALAKYPFDLVIYDELQFAKNEKSLTNKALKNIDATMRLGLSGTPIENRLFELKALFDLVIPTYLPSSATFRTFFVLPIEKQEDREKRALLSRLIRPFLLRRKKSEVLTELPEKIEEVSLCDLSEEQSTLYKQIVDQYRKPLLDKLLDLSTPPPIVHIFSMLSKLKQVCNHSCLIGKNPTQFHKHQSGKWDLFVELVSETRDSGQKLVVFSQYLTMLDIMGLYFKEQGIEFAEIRGSTRNRQKEIDRFSQDPKCEIFLGSLQAAGVGIDLIAASVVIHYDRWWNPAKENQATDRVHRMGQKRGVQVFKLVTKNTIEEHIHLLIEKKLSLAKGVIGFDKEDQIKGLERGELIEILQMLG